MITVPYLPLIVGPIVAFILGMLWYSPFLFGRQWAQAHGFSEQKMREMHSSVSTAHILGFLTYFVTAYVIWYLFSLMNITTMQSALCVGFMLWLGFPAAQGFMSTQYSGKPMKVFLIDTGYHLLYILALCEIIFYFR